MVWTVNTYKGQKTWYEAELINEIKEHCKDFNRDCIQECKITEIILNTIQSYEGERCQ